MCGILADADGAVEVRAAVGGADGADVMKFVLLMAEEDHFDRWDAADEAMRERVVADFEAFDAAVDARGSVVGGEALRRPDERPHRCGRARAGR